MLKPPRFIALRRAEVKSRVDDPSSVMRWANGTSEPVPIWADGTYESLRMQARGRTLRQTIALRDVRYRLHARLTASGGTTHLKAQRSRFERRAVAGACFQQPYLGSREFVGFFELADAADQEPPVALDLDIGLMLYDVFALDKAGDPYSAPSVSLFRAALRGGVLEGPPFG